MTMPKYLNRVKDFALGGEYRVRIIFREGYAGEVDLWPLFANPRGPLLEPFHNPAFFQRAFLEEGTLAWPNGYDTCADVLPSYVEQGRVTSREEMNAYVMEHEPARASKAEPRTK